MLPTGSHVRQLYLEGDTSIFQARAIKDRLLLECSTIEVGTAKEIGRMALGAGNGTYIDAPVSVRSRAYILVYDWLNQFNRGVSKPQLEAHCHS